MPPGAHKDCTTDAIVHGVAWVTFALFLLGATALLVLWSSNPNPNPNPNATPTPNPNPNPNPNQVLWSFMDESRTEPFVGCFFVCSIAAMTYFCKASG